MTQLSQIKPRLGQEREGLRCKIKTPIWIYKPIAQAMEKQPKVIVSKTPKLQDKVVPIPNYTIPQMKHRGDTISRQTIQKFSREIPIYSDPVYRPPPKPVKHLYPRFLEAY